MVVQTTGYVNFGKFFEWVLVNLSILFQIVATIVYGFPFFIFQSIICVSGGAKVKVLPRRDDEICERGKVLIPQQRQRIIKLEAELADCKKREKFLVVVVALIVVIFAVLCLLGKGVEITCVGCCAW